MNAQKALMIFNDIAQATSKPSLHSAMQLLYVEVSNGIADLEYQKSELQSVVSQYNVTLEDIRNSSNLRAWVKEDGKKIPAIKRLRQLTGCGLKEGKDFSEMVLGF